MEVVMNGTVAMAPRYPPCCSLKNIGRAFSKNIHYAAGRHSAMFFLAVDDAEKLLSGKPETTAADGIWQAASRFLCQ